MHEIVSKAKEWHAAREAVPIGQPTEEWKMNYMRKQFPPSWFLSGNMENFNYDMDSPIPLSYHEDEEVLACLPDLLRPRYAKSDKAYMQGATGSRGASSAEGNRQTGKRVDSLKLGLSGASTSDLPSLQ